MKSETFDINTENRRLACEEAPLLFFGLIEEPSQYHLVTDDSAHLLNDPDLDEAS